VGGSFAQTGLPTAVTSATYDAANELTNWNGLTISYDLNGNMLSDGSNTFSWNARNQVATLNSVSLQYDGFGRRTKNLQNTSFLFDGANAVQELSGSTTTANLISGGIDEIFTRADVTGSFTPLKDVLGSTIALVDASGNLVTQYAYDPFGNTTVSGTTSSNAFQYTGRENEGNGLYFYRSRYYSPMLGRFINEDPLGFEGSGPNFYSYVFDNPINLVDPFGLSTVTAPTPTSPPPTLVITVESLEGPSAFALLIYEAKLSSELIQTVSAINAENTAYGEEWQSVIAYNQAVLAHPRRPLPLAGRYTGGKPPSTGGGGDDDDDCTKQWKKAGDYCSQLDDLPRNSPEFKKVQNIFGRDILDCMSGQVDQRCGGHKVW